MYRNEAIVAMYTDLSNLILIRHFLTDMKISRKITDARTIFKIEFMHIV